MILAQNVGRQGVHASANPRAAEETRNLQRLFGCFVRMLVMFRPFRHAPLSVSVRCSPLRYAPAVLTFSPVLVATQGLQ